MLSQTHSWTAMALLLPCNIALYMDPVWGTKSPQQVRAGLHLKGEIIPGGSDTWLSDQEPGRRDVDGQDSEISRKW